MHRAFMLRRHQLESALDATLLIDVACYRHGWLSSQLAQVRPCSHVKVSSTLFRKYRTHTHVSYAIKNSLVQTLLRALAALFKLVIRISGVHLRQFHHRAVRLHVAPQLPGAAKLALARHRESIPASLRQHKRLCLTGCSAETHTYLKPSADAPNPASGIFHDRPNSH